MASRDRVSELSQHFENEILSGKLAPGDVLPSERTLSEQLGVSRSVLREVLGRLASLGLVQIRHGSGTRVTPPNGRQVVMGYERLLRDSSVHLEDLAAVRLPLETAIAAQAAERRTDEHLSRLEKTQTVLANPKRSLATHVRADFEFHATLAEATGNPFFSLVLAPIHELLIESRIRTLGQFGAQVAHAHHAKILNAVRRGDAAAASAAMTQHLTVNSDHLQQMQGEIRKKRMKAEG